MIESSSDEEDDELEVCEAVFAYFCEKNVLPLLIDSFFTRPMTPLTFDYTDDSDD